MKKILLFSLVFLAAGTAAVAQKKNSNQPVTNQTKTIVMVKKASSCEAKAGVPKNKKNLDLVKTKQHPIIVPAELKDERAN